MDKRKLILDAALRLLVEYGFHGTPTSKIAQEAGVANGTLFHYFPTKDDLVMALYVDIKIRLNSAIAENAEPGPSLKETMKGTFLASIYWALDNKDEFRFIQQFQTSPFYSSLDPAEAEQQLKPHLDLLRRGIKEKIIKSLPVDLLFTLITSHTYALIQYLSDRDFTKAQQHQFMNDSFGLLWDMVT